MNERIRTLAEQAGKTHAESFRWEYMNEIDKDIFEKFAELIVQECVEISKNYAGGPMPLSIALAIKEHFGVGE